MKTERRFLIGQSLVRLIQRERFPTKDFVEGYLQSNRELTHFVRLEPGACNIVLQTFGQSTPTEERTKISTSQADALLDVCAGKVVYRRTQVRIGQGLDVFLDRFEHPGGLNLLALEFENQEQASDFSPPEWFGTEVTQDPSYKKQSIALSGLPSSEEVAVSNAIVIALLDTLEGNAATCQALPASSAAIPDGNAAVAATAHERPEKMPPVVPFSVPAPKPAVSPHVPVETPAALPGFDAIMAGIAQAIESGEAPTEQGPKETDPAPKVHTSEAIPLLKRLRG